MLKSAVTVLVAGLRKGPFAIKGKQNEGKILKLRNFLLLEGKLLHALLQKSRGKQYNMLRIADACAVMPWIHYLPVLSRQVTAADWNPGRSYCQRSARPGKVTSLLITQSIPFTSDTVIERLSFGEFHLFWPREVHRAARSGSSLLPRQSDKSIHTVPSVGLHFLHLSSLPVTFSPPAGLYRRKDIKKSMAVVRKPHSVGAVPWTVKRGFFRESQGLMEV